MKQMDFYTIAASDIKVENTDMLLLVFFFMGVNIIRFALASGGLYFVLNKLLPKTKFGAYSIEQKVADYSKKQFTVDVNYTFKALITVSFMTTLFLIFLRYDVYNIYFDADKYGVPYMIFCFILIVILQDIYFYITHRLLHTKWLFKKVHYVHHLRGKNINPMISFRFHFVEIILLQCRGLFLYTLFPVHPYVIMAYDVFFIVFDIIGHSGYEFQPKKWVNNRFTDLMTAFSTYHYQHHKYVHCNYSIFFTIWDRLLKTEHPKYKEEFIQIKEAQEKRLEEHKSQTFNSPEAVIV